MRTELVIFTVAVALVTAAPSPSTEQDMLEDFKIYQKPQPVDGFNANPQQQSADLKFIKKLKLVHDSDDYQQQQESDDFKIYQKPQPVDGFITNQQQQSEDLKFIKKLKLVNDFNDYQQQQKSNDFKIYQNPQPFDGFDIYRQPIQPKDIKFYSKPQPVDGFNVFQQPIQPEDFKVYQKPQPVDGFNFFPTPRPVEDIKIYQNPQPLGPDGTTNDGFNFDLSGFDFWSLLAPEGQRHKREVCVWLGQKACQFKCKLFGRGATQGRCLNGNCECLYPGQYPGLPNFTG